MPRRLSPRSVLSSSPFPAGRAGRLQRKSPRNPSGHASQPVATLATGNVGGPGFICGRRNIDGQDVSRHSLGCLPRVDAFGRVRFSIGHAGLSTASPPLRISRISSKNSVLISDENLMDGMEF